MIERLPIDINLQLGEYRNVKFDIIPKETFVMVYSKINEIIDYANNNNEKQLNYQIDKMNARMYKGVKNASVVQEKNGIVPDADGGVIPTCSHQDSQV